MKQQIVPITGGLNLVKDPTQVDQGSAQECLNYEVANIDGARRIEGFIPWDGRTDYIYKPRFVGASTDPYSSAAVPVVGDLVTFSVTRDDNTTATHPGLVVLAPVDLDLQSGLSSADFLILVLDHMVGVTNPLPSVNSITWSGGSLTTAGILEPIDTSVFSVETLYENYPYAYAAFRDLIEALPGDALTRIPGLHFFNNRLYAIVDLVALRVSPEEGATELQEGAVLYASSQTGPIGKIARVTASGVKTKQDIELFDWSSEDDDISGDTLYAPVSGTNLCTNGTFSFGTGGAQGWTQGLGWNITGGKAEATSSSATLVNGMTVTAARKYVITYTISDYSGAGTLTVSMGGATGAARSANGTYTDTLTTTSTAALTFTAASSFTGKLDDVSVVELGPDIVLNGGFDGATSWSVGSGWSILGGVATATVATAGLINAGTVVAGVTYMVTYTITRTAGSVQIEMGGATGAARSASGTYVDFLTTVSTVDLEVVPSLFSGTIDDISAVPVRAVGEVVSHLNPTRATIYYADWNSAGGWTRQDLGRVLPYIETSATDPAVGSVDGAFFLPYQRTGFIDALAPAEAADTGWIGADSFDTVGQGASWTPSTGGSELESDDGTVVAAGVVSGSNYTDTLRAFWSSDVLSIPAGALVTGIEVRVRRGLSASFPVRDVDVQVWKGGTSGDPINGPGTPLGANKPAGFWLQAETVVTYGGQFDTWGSNSLRPTDINSGGMHLRLRALLGSSGGNAQIDQVEIKVHYQNQTRRAYVHNANAVPQDREIEVIHYTVNTGNFIDNDREGVLVLSPALSAPHIDNPWNFTDGLPIYTETAAGGALLAYTAGTDKPLTLPSSYAVAAESARYQFESANPYAADLLDVLFIASGAEQAYMFDSEYLLPIATGLVANLEKPRHVAWAHNFLALGYRAGTVQVSDLGNPLTWVSDSSLAAEIGAGRRITGLLPMKGNSLGVWTDQSIFVLQGSDPESLTRQDISLDSGAIEYTVVNMGQPMFCDYRGIGTLSTTDQYGDFQAGRISWASTPWLLDRLQSDDPELQPVFAFPVRNKNQYRLVFADGFIHTTTIRDPDGAPFNTVQRYYGDWTDQGDSRIRLLAHATGTTNTGKDVLFASFDYDPTGLRYRYVFQLDVGRSFDGEEIYATWVGQPLNLGSPFQVKQLDQVGVLGRAFGYANVDCYLSTDLETPEPGTTTVVGADPTATTLTFGETGSFASTERYFRDIAPKRSGGDGFTLAFKSVSATQLPHTIQTVVLRFEALESKR